MKKTNIFMTFLALMVISIGLAGCTHKNTLIGKQDVSYSYKFDTKKKKLVSAKVGTNKTFTLSLYGNGKYDYQFEDAKNGKSQPYSRFEGLYQIGTYKVSDGSVKLHPTWTRELHYYGSYQNIIKGSDVFLDNFVFDKQNSITLSPSAIANYKKNNFDASTPLKPITNETIKTAYQGMTTPTNSKTLFELKKVLTH